MKPEDLTGYKQLRSHEQWGDINLGIKIFVKAERELGKADEFAGMKAVDMLQEEIGKETMRLRPEEHEAAALERREILSCFYHPIYVEEISNGYCSRYCCSQKPWFIVTTSKGRFKIGWRKSVIHLEWTESAVKADAATIFPKEEAWPGYVTTQYSKVIHAHSLEKAVEYIRRIMEFKDAEASTT